MAASDNVWFELMESIPSSDVFMLSEDSVQVSATDVLTVYFGARNGLL